MNQDWSNLVERACQVSLRAGLRWAQPWAGDKIGGRPRVPPLSQKTWKEAGMFSAREGHGSLQAQTQILSGVKHRQVRPPGFQGIKINEI